VYVASLLEPKHHLLLFFVLIGFDISKTLPWCFYTLKNLFSPAKKTPTTTAPNPLYAVAMKATASFIREKVIQDA